MSYYYYPYLFDSESYLSKRGTSEDVDSLLNSATDYDFKFQMDLDGAAADFTIDEDLSGNLPQVLANALGIELVDIENEETQEEAQRHADILKKIGDVDGMFSSQGILEPFVGFITKEDVVDLINFLENFTFQDQLVEELKGKFLNILNVAKNNNRGLIYIFN